MAYTPQEQAEWSARYPNLVWVDGEPFTTSNPYAPAPTTVHVTPDGRTLDEQGNPVQADPEGTLYPANLTTRFPWELAAAMVAAPAVVSGISSGVSALSGAGGGAASGAGGGAASASTYGGLPIMSGAPVLPSTTASISAPAAAITGGGGMGFFDGFMDAVGGWKGLFDLGGRAMGAFSQAKTQDRNAQAELAWRQAQLAQRSAEADAQNQALRARIQMEQQEAERRAQQEAFQNALYAERLLNFTPTTIDRSAFRNDIPTITFAQQTLSPEAQALLRERSALARTAATSPMTFEPLPEYTAPAAMPTESSSAGFWERLLGMGSVAGAVLGGGAATRPGGR